jgi:flagellar basal-body rod protein FlgB
VESNGLYAGTIPVLEKVLDLRSAKHGFIISNIANMDTPNYRSFDLLVKEEMQRAADAENSIKLRQTHSRHLPLRAARAGSVDVHPSSIIRDSPEGDYNTVDIDKEMANLAENSLLYNASAQILAKKFEGLKNAIQIDRG